MAGRGAAWKGLVFGVGILAALTGCGKDDKKDTGVGPQEPTTPIPAFTGPLIVSPGFLKVRQGASFTIRATVVNQGLDSPGGVITALFPGLTDSADVTIVSGSSAGDLPGSQITAPDSSAQNVSCASVPTPCLMATYEDELWLREEVNSYVIRVRPQTEGTFSFLLRAGMIDRNGGECGIVSALPPGGLGEETDPLGWPVKRFEVQVVDQMEEVRIPSGLFLMGSPLNEVGRPGGTLGTRVEVRHEVTLTRAFYMLAHEVNQELWEQVMGYNDATYQAPWNPVEGITWFDAISFCNRLSTAEGLDSVYVVVVDSTDVEPPHHVRAATVTWDTEANGYRLPSEAEWEYACRGGTTTAFFTGGISTTLCTPLEPNLDLAGWYCGNSGGQSASRSQAVARKAPNAYGLYDVHGNVNEWCWDYYRSDYEALDSIDPTGPVTAPPETGELRVYRGGSWNSLPYLCRSARRGTGMAGDGSDLVGLRVVRTEF